MIAPRRRSFFRGGALSFLVLCIAGVPWSGCRRAEPPPQEPPPAQPAAAEQPAPILPGPATAPSPAGLPPPDRPIRERESVTTAAGEPAKTPAPSADPSSTSAPPEEALGYDPAISPTARAKALADEGTPAAYLELIRLINNLPDGLERREALVAATRIENPATTALLFETVRVSGDPELVQSAQMSLGSMTNEGVVWLTVALYRGTEDPAQQDRLLGVLRQGRQSSHVAALVSVAEQLAGDPTDPLVMAALNTLGLIGTQESITYLAEMVNAASRTGQDPTLPAAALGRVVAPEALPTLTALAEGHSPGTSPEARIAATRALGHFPLDSVEATLSAIAQNATDPLLINAAQEAMNLAMGQVPSDFSGTP
ncbi:MAG: hypothetical protein KA248_05420 [Kiritimatiellae bacterium]|nr:hypothetical protein [Kiritimatiellia bacterium]